MEDSAGSYAPGASSTEPMVEEPDEPHASSPPLSSSHKPAKPSDAWFSFNGLDLSQWRSKMHEFSAWIDNRLTTQASLWNKFSKISHPDSQDLFENGSYS